jgi:hypothetical protein
MKLKKALPWLCILAVVLWTIFGAQSRPMSAQDSSDPNADMLAKLDQVLENQKNIIAVLASLKEELRVIKIRVTQQQ